MGDNDDGSKSKWRRWWNLWAMTDVLLIAAIALVGIGLPDQTLDYTDAWKNEVPGQRVNLTFDEPTSSETYETEVWLKDPTYAQGMKKEETVDTTALIILCGIVNPAYVLLFLLVLTKIPKKHWFQRFEKRWVWYEYITYGYAWVIAMSINYWLNKTLKILVSMPIPDFYERCNLDDSNLDNLECLNDDEGIKSWKSFPSGHSSNLFTVGTVCVFYTWNKLNLFETFRVEFCHHRWYYRPFLDFVLLWPIFLAAWGAFSRVNDHVHTPTDILGGACLGYVAGHFGYYSQYKKGSPWSYRLLFWPEIRKVIENHATLKRKMYPKLFEQSRSELLQEMTKYRFEQRGKGNNRRDENGKPDDPNNQNNTELAAMQKGES